MILQAEITKKGTLNAKIPKSLWGKKVVVSIQETEAKQSNWDKISAALEKVDALDLPGRTYKEILVELRAFKETESAYVDSSV
ncbi:MAG: hypothetical protein HC887_05430 [Desulfobacteraceae bacterium]|nr:hypothetical protein [Desulfobacteraceae bacterium]